MGSVLKFSSHIHNYRIKTENLKSGVWDIRFIKARDILEATKLACVDKEVWVVSVSQED
jgi:hypothetical protein